MSRFKKYFYLISFLFLIQSISCNSFKSGGIAEGEIVYKVTYPNANAMLSSILPGEMSMKFKNGMVYSEFSNKMGLFSAFAISDPQKKTLTQMIKVLNDKKYFIFDKKGVDKIVADEPKINIELLPEYKTILGYKCKKARVTYADDESRKGYDIYYTKEIAVPKINWWTPLKEIDGVIMEGNLSRYNIVMKLEAKEVIRKEIEEQVFNVPKDYKMVTQSEIDEIFNNFQ